METENVTQKEPTAREKINVEVEKTRLNLVNLQSQAYELMKQLESIEGQIVPAMAAYQTAVNVLKQTEGEVTK